MKKIWFDEAWEEYMRIEEKGDCYDGSSLFLEIRFAQDGKDHVHI